MKETYSRSKSVWQRMNARERKAAMAYGEKYKAFLDTARTERLAAAEIIRRAEEKGFKPVYTMKSLKAGDKVYWNQKDKSVILAVIGKEPVHEGIKIVGSHIDSPRLDLKANPVHEQDGIVYFRTHYYGGIKKYQWTCIPLALIGVVFTKDGKKVDINIGLKDSDPVFYVSDLLIHMAQDQMKKTLAEGITGEQLQAVAGTHSEEGQTPKDAIMTLLKKEYGIEEEEIGSYGNTGMESSYFVKFVMKLLALQGQGSLLDFYETMENSEMLSADVNSCLDPMFPEVSEKDNASFLGYGINLTKYGGSRGKSGSNDANAEFLQKVRKIFNDAGVCWQIGELGKVDQGGGGTIAFMMANWGAEVVDCGTSMLSMHAPCDLLSKADAYETYLAYKAFFESR